MCEKKFGLPTFAVETYGMGYYDDGASLAYMTLLKALERGSLKELPERYRHKLPVKTVGVLGLTPLDLLSLDGAGHIREELSFRHAYTALKEEKPQLYRNHMTDENLKKYRPEVLTFGMDSDLAEFARIFSVDELQVVSPAGLKPARYLHEQYDIPFTVGYPMNSRVAEKLFAETARPLRVLLLHQQILANSLRDELRTLGKLYDLPVDISVGTFFTLDREFAEAGDKQFAGEDEFLQYVKDGNFDVIVGDPMYKMALKWWNGLFQPLPQYAVSGEAHEARTEKDLLT